MSAYLNTRIRSDQIASLMRRINALEVPACDARRIASGSTKFTISGGINGNWIRTTGVGATSVQMRDPANNLIDSTGDIENNDLLGGNRVGPIGGSRFFARGIVADIYNSSMVEITPTWTGDDPGLASAANSSDYFRVAGTEIQTHGGDAADTWTKLADLDDPTYTPAGGSEYIADNDFFFVKTSKAGSDYLEQYNASSGAFVRRIDWATMTLTVGGTPTNVDVGIISGNEGELGSVEMSVTGIIPVAATGGDGETFKIGYWDPADEEIDFECLFTPEDAPDGGYSFTIHQAENGRIYVNIFYGSTAPLWRVFTFREPYTYEQTEFYRYPTSSLADKESLGTPDGGVSVPADDALEADTAGDPIRIRPNNITDMRDAIEAVAPLYENAATGNPYNWTDSDPDNLYNVVFGGSDYDWQGDISAGARMRETVLDEIDQLLDELEAASQF